MASSLGIYIDDSMIKYAKVSKDKDSIKVDSFNVMFYEDLGQALQQVLEETNAYRLPICTNIGNEIYGYAEIFAELSKKDIKSSVEIEFEMDCNEKNYNKDTLEMRYLVMNDAENTEKYKALYIATEKAEISKRAQYLGKYKLAWMTPISRDIVNLLDIQEKDNIAIINVEDDTRITTVLNGAVNRVDTVNIGMKDILAEINKTENSLAKSYDICRNITVYTQDMKITVADGNEHLEDVMPSLYKIVTECKKILDSTFGDVSRIYLTGSGVAINNLDLYFQEYIPNIKVDLLRPYFLEGTNVKTSIKEYIEVNSATALALNALGMGVKDINYATAASAINVDVLGTIKRTFEKIKSKGAKANSSGIDLKQAFAGPLSAVEKLMVRASISALAALVGFTVFAGIISDQIESKKAEVIETLTKTKTELAKIDTQISTVSGQTAQYKALIDAINELNNPTVVDENGTSTAKERIIAKDAIPNLLTKIMTKIPQRVRITSIENTEADHIVIEAQSTQYEQLGYFKGLLSTGNILLNVKSTSGIKDGDIVKITIEGDLP